MAYLINLKNADKKFGKAATLEDGLLKQTGKKVITKAEEGV